MSKIINESNELDEAVPGAGLLTTLKSKLPGSMGIQAKGQIQAAELAKELYKEYYAYIGKIGQQPNSKNIVDFLTQKGMPTAKASEEMKKQVAQKPKLPDITPPTQTPAAQPAQPAAQPAATTPAAQPAVTAESAMRNLLNIIESNFYEQTPAAPIAGGKGIVGSITQRTSNRVGQILLAAVQEYLEKEANKPATQQTPPAPTTQQAPATQQAPKASGAPVAQQTPGAKVDVNSMIQNFNSLSPKQKQQFMNMIQRKA